MQLSNSFRVPLSQDETWDLFLDLPKIAPCVPGARLDGVVDGEYRGGLVAKVGPVTARYRGTVRFLERDAVGYRAVIEARGREEKGNGSANATVTATLRPDGAGTRVEVVTDLTVGGRVAQFGRSMLAEISGSMVDEFVRRLEAMIADGGTAATGQGTGPAGGAVGDRAAEAPTGGAADAGLDVVRLVIRPVARRAALPALCLAIGGAAGYLLGRRA